MNPLRTLLAMSLVAVACGADDLAPDASKLWTWCAIPNGLGHGGFETGVLDTRSSRSWDASGTSVDRGGRYADTRAYVNLAVGIAEEADLSLRGDLVRSSDQADGRDPGIGLGDPCLRGTWRVLCADDERFNLAILPAITAPWGRESDDRHLYPGAGFWQYELAVAASQAIGSAIVQADAGWALYRGSARGTAEGHAYADLAFGWQLTDSFQPEIELNWYRARQDDSAGRDPKTLGLTGGMVTSPADAWVLLAGAQRVVVGRNADQTTTLVLIAVRSW
jgi:hypothetical protein